MTEIELIFIPSPGIGHLRPIVKLAKQLITTDTRLSILVIIIPSPTDKTTDTTNTYISQDRLRYEAINPITEQPQNTNLEPGQVYIEKQKQKVKETVANTIDPTKKLGCFVVDMFCCSMIDVANEFKVPCYMIYTSNATFLGITLHVQEIYDEKKYDTSDLDESVKELEFPCLTRPYPVKCLPHILVSKEWLPFILNLARYFRKMEGILVNTVAELEPQGLKMFSSGLGFGLPKAYPVGPVLHLENDSDEKQTQILWWLDEQPPKSVVFLCFGSMGGFTEEQAREVAVALERSGHRFLWSLRRASSNILTEKPGEIKDFEEVLPTGFLDRTSGRGKVIGWAPQVAVLAKPAIGGFVTHCGWNSMLEGLWFGVPMVAWPLYAEQKVNAFEMVEELGLAVEIKKCIGGDLVAQGGLETVTAEEIERAIRCLMEQDSDVRKKVKDMAEKCHVALVEGGSSHVALQKFIRDVTEHVT